MELCKFCRHKSEVKKKLKSHNKTWRYHLLGSWVTLDPLPSPPLPPSLPLSLFHFCLVRRDCVYRRLVWKSVCSWGWHQTPDRLAPRPEDCRYVWPCPALWDWAVCGRCLLCIILFRGCACFTGWRLVPWEWSFVCTGYWWFRLTVFPAKAYVASQSGCCILGIQHLGGWDKRIVSLRLAHTVIAWTNNE